MIKLLGAFLIGLGIGIFIGFNICYISLREGLKRRGILIEKEK